MFDAVRQATGRTVKVAEAPDPEERDPGKFAADATIDFGNGTSRHVFVEDAIGADKDHMRGSESKTPSSWS